MVGRWKKRRFTLYFLRFLDPIFRVCCAHGLPTVPSDHPDHGTPQTSSTRRGVGGGERLVWGWVEEVAIVAGAGREELVGGHGWCRDRIPRGYASRGRGEGRVVGWPTDDGRAHAYKLLAHVAAAGTATQGPSAAAHTRPASARTHVHRGVVVIGRFRRRYQSRTYVGYRSRVVAHRRGRRCHRTTHTAVAVAVVVIVVAVVRNSVRNR